MKESIDSAVEINSNETNMTNYPSEIKYFEKSTISDKSQFKKESKDGMTIEEFRAAALEHINNLPWKK